MGYNRPQNKMKKLLTMALSVMCLLLANTTITNAQQRTKIADGYYIVNYGNVSVIEDDNRQMSFEIKVENAGTNNLGEKVYNVFCKNGVVKMVTKWGLKQAIHKSIIAAGVPIPSGAVDVAVEIAYEGACYYFSE